MTDPEQQDESGVSRPKSVQDFYRTEQLKLRAHKFLDSFDDLTRASSDLDKLCGEVRNVISQNILDDQVSSNSSQKDIASYYAFSNYSLPGYSTVDTIHVKSIRKIISNIRAYADDDTLLRPRNILMLARPGAGKSHFIKCLSKKMSDIGVESITYNMSSLQKNEDLVHVVDAARNMSIAGKLPLLFLDEFDCDEKNYATLLPLLWDGAIHLGHRDLQLGKAIIVLAGSRPNLPAIMENSKRMLADDTLTTTLGVNGVTPKIVDLISRINAGVLEIPDLDLVSGSRDRRIDKICIAISLAKDRFGKQLFSLPRSLLRFVALANFRYSVRGIAHLIGEIPMQQHAKAITTEQLELPFDDESQLKNHSLAYHVSHEYSALGIVNLWNDCKKQDVQVMVDDYKED